MSTHVNEDYIAAFREKALKGLEDLEANRIARKVAARLTGDDQIDLSRRSGRTTRIIDAAIQELLNTGATSLTDHHGTPGANRHAFKIFQKRMMAEHNSVNYKFEYKPNCIIIHLK